MWPQGIEGFDSYCWDLFLDAEVQCRGTNGLNNAEHLYPTKSVEVLSPYKPNKIVKNKRTQCSPFGRRIHTRNTFSVI